ncbi:NADPH-dependent FMN reductase protein (plasmid) [Rhizobium etli bv. mimosae str. IE4771]|uniref:NADPH-dependent FMN reductase protein n=1 Tax=Rhizobium etli bv. mimosae str. IE4771 TaxID=1432050 RepID=A0A060IFE4_RHIET|nr:NAD(P)H-dependent oxidoreductase [Rhizobium sp. IE4771]AIC30705.1 NADPH-dependent FMN reductase protein [Rhizobium sp. IE4771]
MKEIKLIGISGSLRSASFNTAVLTAVLRNLPSGVSAGIADISPLPFYNEELDDADQPEAVLALREKILLADGIVFCSPEYNGGVPGVLKNAIDWLSRPMHGSVFRGKHALIISASPSAVGGARMQAQLRCDLSACELRVLARPQVVVGQAHMKMIDGVFSDDKTLAFAAKAVADLVMEIRIYQAGLAALGMGVPNAASDRLHAR